jgi:tetratricopeptide (TPR) repeat protein
LKRDNVDVLAAGVADDNPMVRTATLNALETVSASLRVQLAWPLLGDPVRAVRIEAARILAGIPTGALGEAQLAQLDRALAEYVDSQLAMAERPEAQVNLGNYYAARGAADSAINAYETALGLDSGFVPAYANLADLYRRSNDEAAAEEVLRRAIKISSGSADLHHALGLSLIRQQRLPDGVAELQLAAKLSPENPRYVYVYAVALNSTGKPQQAIMVLQGAHNAHPNDRDILSALVAFNRDAGNDRQAARYAEKLQALSP